MAADNHGLACQHPDLAALIPAYVLHALSSEEHAALEDHLVTCGTCRATLRRDQATLAAIVDPAPLEAPSPNFRARMLSQAFEARPPIRNVAIIEPLPETQESPARAPFTTEFTPRPHGLSWPPRMPRHRLGQWSFAIAATLLVGMLIWNISLQMYLSVQSASVTQMRHSQQSLAAILAAPHLQTFPLKGTSVFTAHGVVYLDPDTNQLALVVAGLPSLTTAHIYQVWLNHNGMRTSAGIFQSISDGNGLLVGSFSHTLSFYQSLGVTIEPAGGSPQPTTANIMFGSL